jgi:hypothetical protein
MSDLHYYNPAWVNRIGRTIKADVCVYGATSAGIVAAIRAHLLGKSVALLHPGKFIGGLTTGGLGMTDVGRKHVIGGLAREFYRQVGAYYKKEEEFHFEPRAASQIYTQMLHEAEQDVILYQFLDRVEKSAGRITAITTLSDLRVEAQMYIDATYEGDLMAKAGVRYTTGREANDQYGETLNGIQVRDKHQFSNPVDPYVKAGDPSSGLLPYIEADDLSKLQGHADKRVQAYCFRMCMTDDPTLIIPWEKPERYDPLLYVLAERWFSGDKDKYNEQLRDPNSTVPAKFDVMPNRTAEGFRKTDTNNHGPVSSDFIGANYGWPEGSYEQREKIFQAHVNYQKGFYWFMANSPTIPERYRRAYSSWGLPKDEFEDTGHWPHSLYIREARRMVADYVITEHDCRGTRRAEDSVGMGSYGMDSHNCARFVTNGRVMNDGDVQVGGFPAYPIPYRSIVPKGGECQNLIVPVCLSSSHIAYGSARMEPVFMVLGESAAYAASLSIDDRVAVQDLPYKKLMDQLLVAQQVLSEPSQK